MSSDDEQGGEEGWEKTDKSCPDCGNPLYSKHKMFAENDEGTTTYWCHPDKEGCGYAK